MGGDRTKSRIPGYWQLALASLGKSHQVGDDEEKSWIPSYWQLGKASLGKSKQA